MHASVPLFGYEGQSVVDGFSVIERIQKARANLERHLNLSRADGISEEAAALLGELTHLEELDLAACNLTVLPEAVSALTGLKYLYLYNNQLTALPGEIGNLTSLVMLHLAYNELHELPEAIGDLADLDRIDLDVNRLEALPVSIARLRHLRHLNLARNQLARLPQAIGALHNLEWLNLSSNRLVDLPENLAGCTKLETLYLNDNRLQTLPGAIGKLTRLRRLLPTNNRLRNLPESIGNLQALTELDLSDNQLETLPDSVGNLKLSQLNLANNQLKTLPASMNQMGTLVSLDLRNNPLEALPAGLRINWLDISGCGRLRALPSDLIVKGGIELEGTDLTLPPSTVQLGQLTWHGIQIGSRVAFEPQTIAYQDILRERNVERRRILLERMGYEAFVESARAMILDTDRDRGGKRQLLQIEMIGDEPLVCLSVKCPSTRRKYMLRVPPTMRSCRQAAAWIAGFDNPDDYRPHVET